MGSLFSYTPGYIHLDLNSKHYYPSSLTTASGDLLTVSGKKVGANGHRIPFVVLLKRFIKGDTAKSK
jgi:hypothetical protein